MKPTTHHPRTKRHHHVRPDDGDAFVREEAHEKHRLANEEAELYAEEFITAITHGELVGVFEGDDARWGDLEIDAAGPR
jgi:hypothetical protein